VDKFNGALQRYAKDPADENWTIVL